MADSLTNPVLAEAWQRFHTAQQTVLGWMQDTPRYKDVPQHRAKAYHTLMEALAMAYNFAVAPRMHHPRLQVMTGWQTDFYTLGQNCPDFHYAVLMLDGAQTYRLTGDMGDCPLILLQVLNHLSGHPESKAIGNHDLGDFAKGDGRSFDIVLSADHHNGDWIPLDRDCDRHFILVRRAMNAPTDTPARLNIERISPIPDNHYDAEEFDEATMARRIDAATGFLEYLIRDFNISLFDFYRNTGGGFNHMAFLPGTITSQVGSPSSNYAMAVYDLAEDEALVITLDALPDGQFWTFQTGDVWSRSLNFTHRQTSLTMRQVNVDSDGAFRAVVSHRDPGVRNWLDTCGRLQGTVVFRNYKATTQPVPRTEKVKLADLDRYLPADTARISADERAAALTARRQAYLKLYGE